MNATLGSVVPLAMFDLGACMVARSLQARLADSHEFYNRGNEYVCLLRVRLNVSTFAERALVGGLGLASKIITIRY